MTLEAQPAPDGELEPGQDGTPEGEPAEPTEPTQAADQSAAEPDHQLSQAEYTRSQQAISQVRGLLGLDRKASREDVIAAIEALKQRPAAADDEGDEDPRITEARAEREAAEERAWNAELRVQTAIYGDGFTSDMWDVMNVARTSNDPSELATAFANFAMSHGPAIAGAVQPPVEPGEQPDPDAVPPPVPTSEGDRGPSAPTTDVPRRGRESGVVSAIRGIFGEAGVGSREQ